MKTLQKILKTKKKKSKMICTNKKIKQVTNYPKKKRTCQKAIKNNKTPYNRKKMKWNNTAKKNLNNYPLTKESKEVKKIYKTEF